VLWQDPVGGRHFGRRRAWRAATPPPFSLSPSRVPTYSHPPVYTNRARVASRPCLWPRSFTRQPRARRVGRRGRRGAALTCAARSVTQQPWPAALGGGYRAGVLSSSCGRGRGLRCWRLCGRWPPAARAAAAAQARGCAGSLCGQSRLLAPRSLCACWASKRGSLQRCLQTCV